MTDTTLLSVRLDSAIANKLVAIAKMEKRSKSFIGSEAIQRYVSEYDHDIQSTYIGLDHLQKGLVSSHDEVKSWIESWGSKKEKSMPASKKKK